MTNEKTVLVLVLIVFHFFYINKIRKIHNEYQRNNEINKNRRKI